MRERHSPRRRLSDDDVSPSEGLAQPPTGAAVQPRAASTLPSNPLVSPVIWAFEVGMFGAGFGAVAGLHENIELGLVTTLNGLPSHVMAGMCFGLFCGWLGGLSLKHLRGRVPAWLGLYITSVVISLPYVGILAAQGDWVKLWTIIPVWALVIAGLIPTVAVQRKKNQLPILPSLLFGVLAGSLIWIGRSLIG